MAGSQQAGMRMEVSISLITILAGYGIPCLVSQLALWLETRFTLTRSREASTCSGFLTRREAACRCGRLKDHRALRCRFRRASRQSHWPWCVDLLAGLE